MAKKSKKNDTLNQTEAKGKQKKSSSKKAVAEAQSEGMGEKVGQLKEFFEESKVELKKVTWPSRKETITTSVAVLVLTFVMALFLGVVDLGLAKLIELILS